MDPVVVVGAGIAGVTCAQTVRAAGVPVRVLDRGHRVGGRMSSRTVDGRRVDTGASYLTVSDDRFAAVVESWRERGLARPWTDTFTVVGEDGSRPSTGPMRWGAGAGIRTLVEDLAEGLDVEQGTVTHVGSAGRGRPTVDGRRTSAVVLAMPDPQARRLLDTELVIEAASLDRGYDPVLSLTATWPTRTWDLDGAFVDGDDDLAWVADDGQRRGDGAPVLVAHSTTQLARRHLDDPQSAAPALTSAMVARLGLSAPPARTHLRRWSFARPSAPRDEPFLLTDSGIGACGDGWAAKPRVEGAYLSGLELGRALVERLG